MTPPVHRYGADQEPLRDRGIRHRWGNDPNDPPEEEIWEQFAWDTDGWDEDAWLGDNL